MLKGICCDLDLQGSSLNVALDTSCQYGDQLCKIIVEFDFKSQSYGPETILLKGHTVTLTLKVAFKCCAPHVVSIW